MAYLDTIKAGAVSTWRTHRVLPSVVGAQAALESGWGTSKLAKPPYNNQFGIKASADWTGRTVIMPTREYRNGVWVTEDAKFRAYDSAGESVKDHGAFFTSTPWREENYKAVVGETDYKKACWALQNAPAPYATDTGYAQKLINLIESNNLQAWDREALADNSNTVATQSQQTVVSKMVGADLTDAGKQYVRDLEVTMIGDSLGVGTKPYFESLVPKANYDVLGSRQITHATNSLNGTYVLQQMKNAGTLKEYVVVILGTNRGVTEQEVNNFASIAGDNHKVIFVDTASEVAHINTLSVYYQDAAKRLNNVYFANWRLKANSLKPQYYSKDGANGEYIHMTPLGYQKHAEFIAQALYEVATANFTDRVAEATKVEFYTIENFDLNEDGLITYDAWNVNADGTSTKYKATKQTDIKGLYSPYGESNIYNPSANQQYGLGNSVNNSNWRETYFEDSEETDGLKLIEKASAELIERQEPEMIYTVNLLEIPVELSIGDTGIFVDHEFNPPLYIRARVLSITTSETNVNLNKVTIGNVTELQPQDKSALMAIRAELQETRKDLENSWIGSISTDMTIVSTNGYVLGDRTRETSLVAKVFKGKDDITDQYEVFTWERISEDTAKDTAFNNALAETIQSSVLTVHEKDVIGNQSKFVARAFNATGELISHQEIVIKRVETALWTDTDTAPPYAIDGATWTKPDGSQWVLVDGVWEERVDQAVISQVRVEVEGAMAEAEQAKADAIKAYEDSIAEAERLVTESETVWQGKMDDYDGQVAQIEGAVQKVIDFQDKVGSDGNPQYNKNRSTISSAVSRGELIPIQHNGLGYVAGQDMVLSFKASCVLITKSQLTLNFTADTLLPEPTPKTKSAMTLNLIKPDGVIPPDPTPTPTPFAHARVVNLSEFGGVGDGSYDNFNAFKSAINESVNEPLVIEIDAGIYNVQGATNDRIQMEPWESAKSKGIRLVGKGDVEIRHNNNRTVNKHEYYFMQLVMSEDSLGFEAENITINGIRNPQEELFYTQSESNPVPNIPLTRGIATTGAHHVMYKNVEFKNMYGGYAIQMSEYRDVTIQDVTFDKVGGNDAQESFGMAIYLGGHSGNAIVNIDNAQAQGMTTTKGLKLSWIGVVLENGSIQSSKPAAWMRDKNTTVNITNSSFMDYQSTFHVESMAGNVYWNVDGLTARGSNYQIVAGVYGEYKESSNNVKMDMMPYGRLWGIVHGLWYTEAQETADNISGHNRMDMYNSVINLKTEAGFNKIPQAVSYGNSTKGYLHNTQLNDVPYKLVQNGSAYLYDSVVNLSQASGETRASLQTGMFGTGEQKVVFDNTLVNTYANRTNVSFGAKPAFVKNTGFVAPFIQLPISPPL